MTSNPLEFINAVNDLVNKIQGTEKFAIPILASKARKGARENPNDQTLNLLANVLTKMDENGKFFITKAEFKNLFSKFASRNTKACEMFCEEIDKIEEEKEKQRAGEPGEDVMGLYGSADSRTANSLSGLWDDNGFINKESDDRSFDPIFANQAKMLSLMELSKTGLSPKSINTFCGNDEFIICEASYETPSGESRVLVPVQLSKSGALIPNLFVSAFGIADLKRGALEEHLLNSAGKSFEVNAGQLLKVLGTAGKTSFLSEFEVRALAAQKIVNEKMLSKTASSNMISFDGPSILKQAVDNYKPENVMLEMPRSEQTEKFASLLESGVGIAEFSFGKKLVDTGRKIVISKMASFGHNAQVSVSSCDDDTIIYAVATDTRNGPVGFEVVADVKGDKINVPAVAAIKDRVFDFTRAGIDEMISTRATDTSAVAKVSPMYALKPSDVMNTLRKAADDGNYKIAEDALMVLSEKVDRETYSKAVSEYMRSLNTKNINKEASTKCSCSLIVKTSTHDRPVCGHLNMPLDDVYQNKHGECVPKYRKEMPDTYEGAIFHTSKIFQ